jgi:hypothetical protein
MITAGIDSQNKPALLKAPGIVAAAEAFGLRCGAVRKVKGLPDKNSPS